MECPHCGEALPAKKCPHCQAEVPEESVYCNQCGGLLPRPAQAEVGSGDSWEDRVLCSDETCIGVIGPDGRCKECGKPYAPGKTED